MIKVSLITVCFNSSKTIESTLKSVSRQNYFNIEYIIIDGGSSDDTKLIVERYNNIVALFVSEPDKGLYDAMNKGIRLSSGDIIGFLNADDVLYSDTTISDIVKLHLLHDVDAVIGNVTIIGRNKRITRRYTSVNWAPGLLRYGFMPPHPSLYIKKNVFIRFGCFDLDYKIASDFDLVTRFFCKHRITWRYSGLYTTSMLAGGMSSSGLKSYRIITREMAQSLDRNNIYFLRFILNFRFLWKIFDFMKFRFFFN